VGAVTATQRPVSTLVAIDDDAALLSVIEEALAHENLKVLVAAGGQAGLELVFRENPQVVLLDLVMPDANGMDLLEKIVAFNGRIDVVLMTGHYSTDSAVEAIQKGAADYLAKPVSISTLQERVGRLLAEAQRRRETLELDRKLLEAFQFEGIVGRSPAVLEMFARIRRVAPHFRTVLVSGPTGSGKELVARALHKMGSNPSGPFAVCNCAAIVETLFESELFGYTKGAFTGATQDKVGLFEFANGGTLFLDEIGEMPLASQAKLLRVLQDQQVQRVGSPVPRKVDVRVVAATNRNLHDLIKEGAFREDLYYRLSMVAIKLPSLCERAEDLPLLQRHFVERFAKQYGKDIRGITRRAQTLLARYSWPGNVRELENVIGNAAMMAEGNVIDVTDVVDLLRNLEPAARVDAGGEDNFVCSSRLTLDEVERRYIEKVLRDENDNVTETAARLGVPRSTLYQRLKNLKSSD
jgi:DNA-binding NtrC family response regulator